MEIKHLEKQNHYMKQGFTQNYLLEFIYGERSLSEYFQLDDHFDADPALRTEFRILYDAYKALPKIEVSPSENCLEGILKYSRT